MLKETAQLLHCQVISKQNGMRYLLTVVYGFNKIEQRKELWNDLQVFAPRSNTPWLICGDFNALLYPQDRKGSPVTLAKLQDFTNCYNNLLLSEIPWER